MISRKTFVFMCLSAVGTGDCFMLPSRLISNQHRYRTSRFDSTVGIDQKGEKKKDQKITSGGGDNNSKREMLSFAVPALGIFLSAPLLSNIDNAFVGKTAGTIGLAALSPGTICIDQMLYLFSFLSRATTGIVSRAYSKSYSENGSNQAVSEKDTPLYVLEAQKAASTPLTVALVSGVGLSLLYAFFTPNILQLLSVDPKLRPEAAKYIYWRGSIAWAALVQNVSLSIMLATRDAISPLKIIGLAAIVNVIGDSLFCVYPLKWGCAGASAATAFATLFSSFFMIKNLAKKKLLPKISTPKRHELKELFDYVGPLFAITITRLLGFMSMQRAAMRCGLKGLAAYQICVNCLIFFLLFGEPLSQLHQTKLPALIDNKDESSIKSTMKSVLTLSCYTAIGVATTAFLTLTYGSGFFTSDPAVRDIIAKTAPAVSTAIACTILGTTFDGAMLASRDFSYILNVGIVSCIMQLYLASRCATLTSIFLSFALRLTLYTVAAVARIGLGQGALGKILRRKRQT